MADPVLPSAPPAPAVRAGDPAYQAYAINQTLRVIFDQNKILIDQARQTCTATQAIQAATTAAAAQAAADQQKVQFFLHTCAFSLSFAVGVFTWRIVVLAKNQRHLW